MTTVVKPLGLLEGKPSKYPLAEALLVPWVGTDPNKNTLPKSPCGSSVALR